MKRRTFRPETEVGYTSRWNWWGRDVDCNQVVGAGLIAEAATSSTGLKHCNRSANGEDRDLSQPMMSCGRCGMSQLMCRTHLMLQGK